jgi:hypothetical protein
VVPAELELVELELEVVVVLAAEVPLVTVLLPRVPLLAVVALEALELEWLLEALVPEAVADEPVERDAPVEEKPEPLLEVALAADFPPPLELVAEPCDDPAVLLVRLDDPEADAEVPVGDSAAMQVPARQA